MAGKIHLLPSLQALGGSNRGCNDARDCEIKNGGVFSCMVGASWIDDDSVIYKQHDNIPGSGNYLQLDSKPNISGFESFCSCDQTFGYSGYDCRTATPSLYFEVAWMFCGLTVGIVVTMASVYNLYRAYKLTGAFMRDSVSKSVLCLLFSGIALILSASFRVRDSLNPESRIFVERRGTTKFDHVPTYNSHWIFSNVFLGLTTLVAVLQVVYCWIQIIQKMKTLGTHSRGAILASRLVLSLEGLFTILVLALVIAGRTATAFAAAVPFMLFAMAASVYGMVRMTKMLKSTVSDVQSITKKTSDGQIESLILRIRKCAIGIVLSCIIGLVGIGLIFVAANSFVVFNAQSPAGGFYRIYMWGNNLAEYTFMPLVQITVLLYLHGLISSRMQRKFAKDTDKTSNSTNQKGMIDQTSSPTHNNLTNLKQGHTNANTGRDSSLSPTVFADISPLVPHAHVIRNSDLVADMDSIAPKSSNASSSLSP